MGFIEDHQNFSAATPDTNENFIIIVPGFTIIKKYIKKYL